MGVVWGFAAHLFVPSLFFPSETLFNPINWNFSVVDWVLDVVNHKFSISLLMIDCWSGPLSSPVCLLNISTKIQSLTLIMKGTSFWLFIFHARLFGLFNWFIDFFVSKSAYLKTAFDFVELKISILLIILSPLEIIKSSIALCGPRS